MPFTSELPSEDTYDLIVDAIFGYSFSGDIRAPFDTILKVCLCTGGYDQLLVA
jgi:NAD(P)H-hydrate repair Nnr-like enzyme with NAD(P)H-hydrate epimerase domain